MSHWAEQYIGEPYVHGQNDCARLVCRIRSEVFGHPVPTEADVERAASRLGRVSQVSDAVDAYGDRVEAPQEGDVALMICCGRPSHVGVYCLYHGERGVLHAMENAGQVVFHRLRDLSRVGLSVEGYYKWK